MEQDLFWVLLSAHCERGDFSLIRLHKVEGEMRMRDEEGEKREGELTHIYCYVSPPLPSPPSLIDLPLLPQIYF